MEVSPVYSNDLSNVNETHSGNVNYDAFQQGLDALIDAVKVAVNYILYSLASLFSKDQESPTITNWGFTEAEIKTMAELGNEFNSDPNEVALELEYVANQLFPIDHPGTYDPATNMYEISLND